ncbi:hypothetical protein ANCDUO_17494 [Ancylostoma duodenale]|uniref:Reverse transcriptase domain-containing protein n=1 Tax=Ancylostoma duodenale TaxID=51022 RepID=A0A0C2G5S0_9BILA|nr:hypothetical protein ANCDUO_17494 [Ancylostoma duodenale]
MFATVNGGAVFLQVDLSDSYLELLGGLSDLSDGFEKKVNRLIIGPRAVATYSDDILVRERIGKEHMEDFLALFERIVENGFKARMENCLFAKS